MKEGTILLRVKKLITNKIVLGFIVLFLLGISVFLFWNSRKPNPRLKQSSPQARDAVRILDLTFIYGGMELYRIDNQKYPQSEVMPIDIVKKYLETKESLQEPGRGPCREYKWISNVKDSQEYCAFACLENGKFYAISPKGRKELDEAPTNLNCW